MNYATRAAKLSSGFVLPGWEETRRAARRPEEAGKGRAKIRGSDQGADAELRARWRPLQKDFKKNETPAMDCQGLLGFVLSYFSSYHHGSSFASDAMVATKRYCFVMFYSLPGLSSRRT